MTISIKTRMLNVLKRKRKPDLLPCGEIIPVKCCFIFSWKLVFDLYVLYQIFSAYDITVQYCCLKENPNQISCLVEKSVLPTVADIQVG